ncbi:hypothetical protein GCM10023213_14070 [Prosthecobacter algae]|uniref:Uncharacterized protein n=1 Tax=Prosthecobacter algae TaxID=1144682 RepID=A0ABP9NZ61_9BACT
MTDEDIKAIEAAHPEAFVSKRNAGLSRLQAALAIEAQLEHDKAHPPLRDITLSIKNAVDLANKIFGSAKQLGAEAFTKLSEAGDDLDPSILIPLIEVLSLVERSEVDNLIRKPKEELQTALKTIRDLEARLVEANKREEALQQQFDGLKESSRKLVEKDSDQTAKINDLQDKLTAAGAEIAALKASPKTKK